MTSNRSAADQSEGVGARGGAEFNERSDWLDVESKILKVSLGGAVEVHRDVTAYVLSLSVSV